MKSEFDSERVLVAHGNVSEECFIDKFKERVEQRFSTVNVLINNAGMRFRKEFLEIEHQEFQEVMQNNLMSVVMMSKALDIITTLIKLFCITS